MIGAFRRLCKLFGKFALERCAAIVNNIKIVYHSRVNGVIPIDPILYQGRGFALVRLCNACETRNEG